MRRKPRLAYSDPIAHKPPATQAEIVALEFKGVMPIANQSKEKRHERIRAACETVHLAAQIGIFFLALDKSEAIEEVKRRPDVFEPFSESLDEAIAEAKMLVELLQMFSARLTVTLASVEAEID